jgi:menaquinol-cytochrome c reductase iron-sulfur subunit
LMDAPTTTLPPRRGFFRLLTGLLAVAAAAVLAIPLVGYFFGRRKQPAVWLTLADVDSYPDHETRIVAFDNPLGQPWDGVTARNEVFVRRQGSDPRGRAQFLVLAVNCAHLGCPVSWFPQSGLFLCPCHGGVYYADGGRASGPPPRGLFHCEWRVRDGKLEIRAPHYPSLHDTLDAEPAPESVALSATRGKGRCA